MNSMDSSAAFSQWRWCWLRLHSWASSRADAEWPGTASLDNCWPKNGIMAHGRVSSLTTGVETIVGHVAIVDDISALPSEGIGIKRKVDFVSLFNWRQRVLIIAVNASTSACSVHTSGIRLGVLTGCKGAAQNMLKFEIRQRSRMARQVMICSVLFWAPIWTYTVAFWSR